MNNCPHEKFKVYHCVTGTIPAMARLDPIPYRAFHVLSQAYGPIVRVVVGIQSLIIFSRYQGKHC